MNKSTNKPRLWTIFILGFVGFVTSFGAHVVAVNLPDYARQIGVGLAVIGLLIAAYDFAEIVAKPVFGTVADRFGMKRTMLMGIALFTLASLLYPYISPNLLLLVRFLQGIGAAALSAVSLALVGVYFTDNRGRAYGIYNVIKGAGYVVSPLVGKAIIVQSNFAAIFYAVAGIGGLAFVLSLLLPKPAVELGGEALDDDDNFSLSVLLDVFKQPRLWTWYAVIVVNMFFVGILFGFLPVRVDALGYDAGTSTLVLTIAALSYLLIQPVAGILADRANPIRTIQAGLVASGMGIILIAFSSGLVLIVVVILAGMGIGTVWTNTDTMISQLAKAGQLGSTMGVAGSFKEFGDMLGPLLIGVISQAFGLTAGFVVCGLLGLLSVMLLSRREVGTV
ncbi:MAG: MFS transporter [Anaerolineae bacterium]|nr:MFS transporter [Anaerolineae bacterium]